MLISQVVTTYYISVRQAACILIKIILFVNRLYNFGVSTPQMRLYMAWADGTHLEEMLSITSSHVDLWAIHTINILPLVDWKVKKS